MTRTNATAQSTGRFVGNLQDTICNLVGVATPFSPKYQAD